MTETMDLFSYAETLRDRAIHQVSREEWMPEAVATFYAYRRELPEVFTGENIRDLVLGYLPAPHHPNAWGALTMSLVKQKAIIATGTVTKMRSPSSHARRTFQYRLAQG